MYGSVYTRLDSPCNAFTGAESDLAFWLLLGRGSFPATGVDALAFELPQPILLRDNFLF